MYHKWWSYDVWFLRYGARQTEYFVILDQLFALLPPLPLTTTQKLKILKKWKKTTTTTTKKKRLDISLFYTIVPKIMIIYHTVPEIWHGTDVIFIFHFGLFLPFYTPTSPPQPEQPDKSKLKKNPWRVHLFTLVYQRFWLHDIRFLKYGAWQMDRRTEGQKKWHIEVGVPPKIDQ